MSRLSKMLGLGRGGSQGEEDSEAGFWCETCGNEVEEGDLEGDECQRCRDNDYSGAKFCCGSIYEEGEYVCASCGDPL